MCNAFALATELMFNAQKTQCIFFYHKRCDSNVKPKMALNGRILEWHKNVTHVGHSFNCCMSFAKDVSIRKGAFIQCIEITTEFKFANPAWQGTGCRKYMAIVTMGHIYGTYMVKKFYLCVKHGCHIRHIVDLYHRCICSY